ncbi:hypothetical protein ABXK61_16225 [Burkholderia sola]|uniref:hypothetical protein n=1 Tax=Burkholderia TaxID=32008 RepID=UPI001AE8BA0B|nr:hypothetical protein [Burkholderia sp. AcTa6-5]MBP0714853.1 hypothetical protein [Burkholderia sp. AcTa6-5]
MNTTKQHAPKSLITWSRSKPESRTRRIARLTLRALLYVFAILGVCFAYLLFVGYSQYQNEVAKGEIQCATSQCL